MATETMEPGFEFCFNSDKFKRPHEASGTALYSTGQSSCKAETSPVHRRPRVTGRAAFLTAGLAWRRGRWGPLKKAVSRTDRPGGSLGSMPSSDNLSRQESAPRAIGRMEVKEASC